MVPKHSLLKYFTLTFTRHKSSKFEGSGPPLTFCWGRHLDFVLTPRRGWCLTRWQCWESSKYKPEGFNGTKIQLFEFGIKYLKFGATYLRLGAIFLDFGATYFFLLHMFEFFGARNR